MAELIPVQYRVRMATKRQLRRWLFVGSLTGAVCALVVSYAAIAERRSAATASDLDAQVQQRSELIASSEELRTKRQNLAHRMEKIQELMDDKVLLSLLRNISGGFSANDCLTYIHVDARGKSHAKDAKDTDGDGNYVVSMTGLTNNMSTLADLMTRLGQSRDHAISVQLDSYKLDKLLDGQAVRFQLTCDKLPAPAAPVSTPRG